MRDLVGSKKKHNASGSNRRDSCNRFVTSTKQPLAMRRYGSEGEVLLRFAKQFARVFQELARIPERSAPEQALLLESVVSPERLCSIDAGAPAKQVPIVCQPLHGGRPFPK